jgi:hypothetical protein
MMASRIASRFARVPLLAGVVALALTGCSNTTTDAATVTYKDAAGSHTVHISRSAFEGELHDLIANKQFAQLLKSQGGFANVTGTDTTDTGVSSIWLTTLIDQVAIDAETQSSHVTVSPADTASGKTAQESTFTAPVFGAFSKSFQDKLIARGAQQAALTRFYESCPSGKFVSHILVKTQAEADAALQLIQAGQKFADVAKLRSTDTGSAPQGGGLGCLTPNEFVAEFQNAAAAAPIGVVTGPVKSQFGYHLILVRKWDPVADQSYVQALAQAAGAVINARVQQLDVRISPRFGTWGKQTDQNGNVVYGVTPPKAPAVRTCREKSAACAPATTTTTTTLPAGG